jgi:hypothetical protein
MESKYVERGNNLKKCKACGQPNHTPQSTCSTQCKIDLLKKKAEIKKAKKKYEKWQKSRGITKRKLDKLWSEKVREKGRCEVDGCNSKTLHAHHVFGRRNYGVRWDLDNGVCLCAGHHKFYSHFSAHETPTIFTEWLIKTKGKEFLDRLTEKANDTTLYKKYSLEEWYEKLKSS